MEGHDTEMLCLFSGALLELQVKVETLGSVDPEFLEWQERNTEWEGEIDEVSTLKGEEKGEVIPICEWEEGGELGGSGPADQTRAQQSFEREIRTV